MKLSEIETGHHCLCSDCNAPCRAVAIGSYRGGIIVESEGDNGHVDVCLVRPEKLTLDPNYNGEWAIKLTVPDVKRLGQ